MKSRAGMNSLKRMLRGAAALLALSILFLSAGCAKENKYVNVGVDMSTAGMSLYLNNTVNGFQQI